MPVRNFRYIGNKQSKSLSDGSGVAELYDIYANRLGGVSNYPHTLYVTSNYDSISSLIEGDRFGPTFTLEGYYVQETFTLSISSGTAYFRDSTGGNSTPTVNASTGTASIAFSTTTFTLASGFAASGAGNTFTMRLTGSISGIVWEKTFNITQGTYDLTFNSSSYNEGSSTACTLTYSGAPPSETIYYGFSPYGNVGGTGITTADVSSTVTGSFTSSSTGSGTRNITGPTMVNDFLTEGAETLQCRVSHYNLSSLSSYYLDFANVTINDTSLTPSASVTASTTSVNEGSTVTFTVTMTNYSSGSVNYDFTLSADAESSDISPSSGSISISSSTGSVVITAVADGYTESGQTETFQLNILSPADGTTVIGSSPVVTINDTSTGTAEPAGIGSDLPTINSTLSSYTESTAVSTVVSALSGLGYTTLAVIGYSNCAESLSGTNSSLTGFGFRYDLWNSSTNYMDLSGGFTNSTLNGYPYLAYAGFNANTFYGTAVAMYRDYTSATTLLKNLWYPNQDRELYTHVRNANGTTVEDTSGNTSTIYSDNQQPTTNGYYQTGRFSLDDGSWGFRNGLTRLDGNGGPYLNQSSSNAYGCENPNAGDTSANDFFWGSVAVSTTYKFYVFTKF